MYNTAMNRNTKGQFLHGTHWRESQPFREKEWLEREYIELGRSTGDIAAHFGVADDAIIHWLKNTVYIVLLCEVCHQFVQSRKNENGDFLQEG